MYARFRFFLDREQEKTTIEPEFSCFLHSTCTHAVTGNQNQNLTPAVIQNQNPTQEELFYIPARVP